MQQYNLQLSNSQVGLTRPVTHEGRKNWNHDKWTTEWILRRLSIYWGRLTIIGHAGRRTKGMDTVDVVVSFVHLGRISRQRQTPETTSLMIRKWFLWESMGLAGMRRRSADRSPCPGSYEASQFSVAFLIKTWSAWEVRKVKVLVEWHRKFNICQLAAQRDEHSVEFIGLSSRAATTAAHLSPCPDHWASQRPQMTIYWTVL